MQAATALFLRPSWLSLWTVKIAGECGHKLAQKMAAKGLWSQMQILEYSDLEKIDLGCCHRLT